STNSGGTYTLTTDLSYKNFFAAFDFFSGPDPTQGFVQYQALEAATSQSLVGFFEDTQSVYMGVDYTTKDAAGRASVRLESKDTFNQGLLVVDVRHMPDSTCGSWPAFWMVGTENGEVKWPDAGEIDILEGVNDESRNAVTLHTSAGCVVDNATTPVVGATGEVQMPYLGTMATDNCDVAAVDQDKNVGCSIKAPEPAEIKGVATYGTEFNNAGGGVYAMEWTDQAITVWFFPRNSTGIAQFSSSSNATSGSNSTAGSSLDASTFGTPLAKFSGSGCDFTQRFKDLKIVFDTTFCGEWAGKVWDQGCAAKTGVATCQEYVQNNPEVFANAYWEVGGLRWYQK
ncbi:glycoside hydrolase family 16 protein, partial [Lentithecium fluviatile CBS 122367]